MFRINIISFVNRMELWKPIYLETAAMGINQATKRRKIQSWLYLAPVHHNNSLINNSLVYQVCIVNIWVSILVYQVCIVNIWLSIFSLTYSEASLIQIIQLSRHIHLLSQANCPDNWVTFYMDISVGSQTYVGSTVYHTEQWSLTWMLTY